MTQSSIGSFRQPARWAALGLIVAAQFIVILHVSIVNVALPEAPVPERPTLPSKSDGPVASLSEHLHTGTPRPGT